MSEYGPDRLERDVLELERARNGVADNPQTGSFMSAPDRLDGELDERKADNERALKFHNAFLDDCLRAIVPTDLILLGAPTGLGKCLAPETPVLMYGGKIVRARDVAVGDMLMGPDSMPRRVLGTNIGRGPMFEIRPTKGDPWRCNDVHVLTLVHTSTGEVIDIPLDEYLSRSKNFKHLHKLFATGVEFPCRESSLPIPPYFLGLWFGDGAKTVRENGLLRVMITTLDPEIVSECEEVAAQFGLKVMPDENVGKCPSYRLANVRGAGNPLLDGMRALLTAGLEVPESYLTASRQDRLEFLAGWLDSDGSLVDGCFDFVQKRDDWAQAVMFLARSLGMRATSYKKIVEGQEYTRVTISGDTSEIPVRIPRKRAKPREQIKDVLRTGFEVVPVGDGEYAGFTLSGDGRFLLGDFTVTHNTDLAMNIATTNAFIGKRAHYFALEAEPRELERRSKYALLSQAVYQARHEERHKMNYPDWRLGRCEHICGPWNAEVEKRIEKSLRPLWTLYRGRKFDVQDLEKHVLDIHTNTDLIVIDHLHYIDAETDQNEAKALGDTVKSIRDLALNVGKPIILIAHLRKKNQNSKRLIPEIDDFHGSSNITKIATKVITIERCHVVDPPKWFLSPTFFAVLKDRFMGAPPFVAVKNFDRRTKSYQGFYTLGRLTKGGTDWEAVDGYDKPEWATHHRPLEQTGGGTQ